MHPLRLHRLLPVVLVAALALAACTGDDTTSDAPTGTTTDTPATTTAPAEADGDAGREDTDRATSPLPIPDIVREVGPSVVSVGVQVPTGRGATQGAGSGVIYGSDGAIVTNNHVVAGADEITVQLASGEREPATLLAADPRTDLAVITIDRSGLPAAEFSQRLPEVGELAVAIGNPLGLENSATAGIVSGLDRSLPSGNVALVGLIQTDAPISPGNSGGALVDDHGRVIGINVAQAGTQRAENLGFAIPATTAVPVIDQLIESGDVAHPYLGIRGTTLTPQVAERFGLAVERGAVVAQVEPGSPAAEAGIQRADVVRALEGDPVESFGDLVAGLRRFTPGDTVSLTVVRGDTEQTVDVTLGALPN